MLASWVALGLRYYVYKLVQIFLPLEPECTEPWNGTWKNNTLFGFSFMKNPLSHLANTLNDHKNPRKHQYNVCKSKFIVDFKICRPYITGKHLSFMLSSWQKNTFFRQILKRWVFMRSVLLMKHFKRLYNLVHCRFMSLNFSLWVRKSCYWLTTPLYTITPIKTTYTKNCYTYINPYSF